MIKITNGNDKNNAIANAQAPTVNPPMGDFNVIWETKTLMVGPVNKLVPVKVLHGYRRYNIDYVVSPEVDHQVVLAVHGIMHNALCFQPLGNQLLGDLSKKTRDFYSISLPGHGDMTPGSWHGVSGIPIGRRYGDVTLEDYAEALIQVAKQLGRIDAIVAHSQGGIVVQLAEAKLQASGSSFSSTAQTSRIVFLASTLPLGLTWNASDQGMINSILNSLQALQPDSGNGKFLSISDFDWYRLFYSHPVLSDPPVPVVGGPDLATVVPHLRTNAPTAASFNALGCDTMALVPRPAVPPNLFRYYHFINIGFHDDLFFTTMELDALGNYLKPGTGHILITSPQLNVPVIHCELYTRPASIVPYLLGAGGDNL